MPEDKIEKPFGTWMRAEPRRKMHTMGNKWLWPGGTMTAKNVGEDTEIMERSAKTAHESNHVDSGIVLGNNSHELAPSGGKFKGAMISPHINHNSMVTTNQGNKSLGEGNDKDMDPNVIIVTDLKRRRMGNEYGPEFVDNPEMDMTSSPQSTDVENQKNMLMTGAAMQARPSS
ncbi:hypothetical protein POM88_033085 [Heracleum sosnowskyi]|uniref:Uncharacterized protein n=1 Tax=Heracleum sosnowskyi TaxID=360622 RepID=A0AAD8ML93_9APIA|nr:hypothetical protein POM88_033085 [Heracleum sosnowskyi]